MKNKGNQKHLTFEQRVDIEKGLTMNATHLITQACHLTVLAMNTWRVSVT